jgi:large-conductance mechanosensitive channel
MFMQISTPVIVVISLILIALVVFIIVRNRKDEKELEQQLDKDFGRPPKHQDDEDISV